ncbi:MAG: glycosyltransferase family 4 protein [Parvicellaceae bacterium]|tara:strand:+ start:7348 stop:8433 length:1086 start_codon:yes stop_codon:yes gene_type:complete
MNIGINARHLIKDRLEGIGWYSFEILKRLIKLMPSHQFIFFYDRKTTFLISGENITNIIISPPARHPFLFKIWFNFLLPKAFKKHQIDLFFSPDGFVSLNADIHQVGVIHDLNFEHYPEDLPKNILKYYKKYMPLFAQKANKVITVSNYSKNDIVNKYKVNSEKIKVIYNGGNEIFKPLSEEKTKIFQTNNSNRPYFIYVGSLHKRKNIERMLKAFQAFNQDNKWDFIIIGTDMWKGQLNLEGILNNVKFLGRKSGNELAMWIASSSALIYISYFEGFGLPILEGMMAGVPVISGNLTSLPEVGGNAVIYVDPFNIKSISKGMEEAISNFSKYRNLGLEQATLFSWDESALEVKKTLNDFI